MTFERATYIDDYVHHTGDLASFKDVNVLTFLLVGIILIFVYLDEGSLCQTLHEFCVQVYETMRSLKSFDSILCFIFH